MKHTYTFNGLDSKYTDLAIKFDLLINSEYQFKYFDDCSVLKEIRRRMELIHFKAAAVNDLIKILNAAEAQNVDLGDEISGSVSSFFVIFISGLDIDMEIRYSRYFLNVKGDELLCSWRKLCGLYKEYFLNTIDLPKCIDLSSYTLALK